VSSTIREEEALLFIAGRHRFAAILESAFLGRKRGWALVNRERKRVYVEERPGRASSFGGDRSGQRVPLTYRKERGKGGEKNYRTARGKPQELVEISRGENALGTVESHKLLRRKGHLSDLKGKMVPDSRPSEKRKGTVPKKNDFPH